MKYDTSEWGTIVYATPSAVKQGLAKEGQRGVLLGRHPKYPHTIKVVKEGTTTAEIYWDGFWMKNQ